jgi:hypothetical protein
MFANAVCRRNDVETNQNAGFGRKLRLLSPRDPEDRILVCALIAVSPIDRTSSLIDLPSFLSPGESRCVVR